MATLYFQERLYGLVMYSPMALLLPTWIRSPGAGAEMVVSQMQGVRAQSQAEPRVCMNGNHFPDITDSRRCGSRASSALRGAVPCSGAVCSRSQEAIPVWSCPGCVGCPTGAGSHPGRTLQEQRGRCRISPLTFGSLSVLTGAPRCRARALTCACPLPAGKHTASSHRLSALVTPAGRSYECQAQQTISLVSSDHQKSVQLLLSEVRLQPFDIPADFVFSEGKEQAEARPASPRC